MRNCNLQFGSTHGVQIVFFVHDLDDDSYEAREILGALSEKKMSYLKFKIMMKQYFHPYLMLTMVFHMFYVCQSGKKNINVIFIVVCIVVIQLSG